MIEKIYKLLDQYSLRVAFAESCTGGLCAAKMVEQPGISSCFIGSQVVYSTQAKAEWLGIDIPDLFENPNWTESSDCASLLAFNLQQRNIDCDIGLAVVGHLNDLRYIHVCIYAGKFGWRHSGTINLFNTYRVLLQQEAANKTLAFLFEYLEDMFGGEESKS